MISRLALLALVPATLLFGEELPALTYKLVPLGTLQAQAAQRVNAKARVPLADAVPTDADNPEPNYLRAFTALVPKAASPFSKLVNAALFTGALDSEVKMAMGVRVSQLLNSPYVAVHMVRVLKVTPRGQALLAALQSGKLDSLAPADRLAIAYAELLTQDIHGVSDEDFRRTRSYFNDGQLVELTTTTCFFNYFTRFAEALSLPVEDWALHNTPTASHASNAPPIARVNLISDTEVSAIDQNRANRSTLRIGFANSMRAMYLAPEMALAWSKFGAASREYDAVTREIKLQVSFAVSMANGCRYCTLHQVLGLRRLNVSPAKLMQMRKDDSALTPEELTAVILARKLTREPWSITDSDYLSLESKFGQQGALEVLMQVCNFAYMNHFTDGLRLPSEDEAVKTYREVYGVDFVRKGR